MCDSIIFKSGEQISSVRQFQDTFGVNATNWGFSGEPEFLDFCMCELDLQLFFETHTEHEFYYDCGDWYQKDSSDT